MNEFRLSLDDMMHHVVSIGLDIYPPIEMKDERTRLNMFFEDVRERWPDMYDKLTTGESEFKISKPFRAKPGVQGPALPVDTFVLTQRGPVFVFPLRLPDPVGPTDLESSFRSVFKEVRNALWSRLPGHTILRVGLIRDVIFSTGQSDCTSRVTRRPDWVGAKLVGGHLMFQYQDPKCNIRLEFSPGRIGKATQLPVGAMVEQPVGFGLKVRLDVNNAEVRPLQETDIEEVIDRALGFWPDELLEYVSGVGS
jgi:hypothetical protein